MDKFLIQGGAPLNGEITPAGNKNAALPLLAACLLTEEPVTLHNVPEIRDVQAMRALIESLGASIETVGNHTWRIQAKELRPADLDPDLCRQIRASILLAGPMVARSGELHLPPPGGDVIGRRRVDTHILALRALGASADYNREEHLFHFKAGRLHGANILLDEASVTATENAIMAAVLAKGSDNPAQCRLRAAYPGAVPVSEYPGCADRKYWFEHTSYSKALTGCMEANSRIGPDYLEVVSFIGAAVVTRGSIRIRKAGPQYLDMIAHCAWDAWVSTGRLMARI